MVTNELMSVLEELRPDIERMSRNRLRPIAKRYGLDDLYQDIAKKVLMGGHRFRGESLDDLRGYLRTIAKNTASTAITVHMAQRRSVRREEYTTGSPGWEPVEMTDPVEALGVREAIASVSELMELLPSRQRIALEMRHLRYLPYAQIAEELKCSKGAARTLVTNGIRKLRKWLAAGEEVLEDHGR
jgi:RNA polymerase sigma factor (sigma-70 family)